jgi:amino acid adenylation domain-containing protein
VDATLLSDTADLATANAEQWRSSPDLALDAVWLARHKLRPEELLIAAFGLVVAQIHDADLVNLGVVLDGSSGTLHSLQLTTSPSQDLVQLCREIGRQTRRRSSDPAAEAFDARLTITHSRRAIPAAVPAASGLALELVLDGLRVSEIAITYDDRITAPALLEWLERGFLRAIASIPNCCVRKDIEWLAQDEYDRIVYQWNATSAPYAYEQCLHWLFEAQARRTPDAVALEIDGQALSYHELERRSRQLACELRNRGVACDVLVPLCAERSLAMVVGILGILRAGGAYVPIDPRFPADYNARVVEDSAPRLIVTESRWQAHMASFGLPVLLIDELPVAGEPAFCMRLGRPEGLACVMHTSGSTGVPKGTLLEHRALLNNLFWLQEHWPLSAGEAVLQKTPFTFDVSIKEFLWPLCFGGRLVLAQAGKHLDIPYLGKLIQQHHVAVAHFVPSILQAFVALPGVGACTSLRLVMCGAEVLPPELVSRFFAVLEAKLLHLYGPTEAAISVTGWECDPRSEPLRAVPLGRPMANVQIHVLNRAQRPVPPGVSGELYIGGIALARGYLRQPGLTEQCFVVDPFGVPGSVGRLYRSGDRARYTADGVIEFLGRFDQQVKIRGARVEPGEIENTLRKHPALARVAVTVRADRNGQKRLVAYVVGKAGPAPGPADLHQFCRAKLPGYMMPSAFVDLAQLPLLANGKVDYGALPNLT